MAVLVVTVRLNLLVSGETTPDMMFRTGGTRNAPYGSWASPITSDLVTAGVIGLGQPRVAGKNLYWIEDRPAEQGRSVLVCHVADGGCHDITPPPYSVRSRVHEYGGGSYTVSGDMVWFVNDSDQCIYRVAAGQKPEQLTPPEACRFADFIVDLRHNRLIAICEDHRYPHDIQNSIVSVELDSGTVTPLISGDDFYSSPGLSADGSRVLWLSWNHPNLPWESTTLKVAKLDSKGQPTEIETVVDSAAESVFQPQFGPDDSIYFVSDRDNWWHVYRYDGEETQQITHGKAEFGMPQWLFGMSTYGFTDDRHLISSVTRDGEWEIRRISLDTGQSETLDLPYSAIDHVTVVGDTIAMVAGGPEQAMAIVLYDLKMNSTSVVQRSSQTDIPREFISRPQTITFSTADSEVAHAFLYLPCNPGYEAPASEKPPLIVKCHGGPTSATRSLFDLRIQYWTSRGFAILDVNYRGSTGYGRDYRRKLYGCWGVADVEDCVSGALYVAARGRADPDRMTIKGGSAGGYTVLCALCFHDIFRAGASYFGVGELEEMFKTTHKFESRYGDWLLGPYAEAKDLYRERSPVHHADKLNCPVIFLQGLDDKVVPPAQSERMVQALRAKGLPVSYLAFEGEAHGFRKASTIRRCIEAELYFYSKIFGFEPADQLEAVEIENFDADMKE